MGHKGRFNRLGRFKRAPLGSILARQRPPWKQPRWRRGIFSKKSPYGSDDSSAPTDSFDIDLLTLWAAHTHLCMETYTTPRLILDSPVPECGKTTVLEHLSRLCMDPVQMATVSSPAMITRLLNQRPRTILIDEVDRALDPKMDKTGELLAVLNSGYKRGATRPVLVQNGKDWDPVEMPTFSPAAMAGNGPQLPDDTRSRSIRVLLMPGGDDVEESDWEMIEGEAETLGKRLADWADQVRDAVRENRPPLHHTVKNRARERWSPLNRVAAQAGGRWPAVVETLAIRDVERVKLELEEGIVQQRPSVVILTHIHAVWAKNPTESFIPTETLVKDLIHADPFMWGLESTYGKNLTAQRLGRMLVSSFNIRSCRPNHHGDPRGYTRQSFDSAFRRMGIFKNAA